MFVNGGGKWGGAETEADMADRKCSSGGKGEQFLMA